MLIRYKDWDIACSGRTIGIRDTGLQNGTGQKKRIIKMRLILTFRRERDYSQVAYTLINKREGMSKNKIDLEHHIRRAAIGNVHLDFQTGPLPYLPLMIINGINILLGRIRIIRLKGDFL